MGEGNPPFQVNFSHTNGASDSSNTSYKFPIFVVSSSRSRSKTKLCLLQGLMLTRKKLVK